MTLISLSGIMVGQKSLPPNNNIYLAMISEVSKDFSNRSGSLSTSKDNTKEVNVVCKKIKLGVSNAKVTLENGEKVKIALSELNSYVINGRMFDKMMVYKNNRATGIMTFMEKMSERDGYILYKYSTYMLAGDEQGSYYYVYKDGKFHSALTEKNCHYVLRYFGLKIDKIYVES